MQNFQLGIFDETLRDGEQQAGLCFPADVKREIADLVVRTGAHQIDLMPAVDPLEAELVRELVGAGFADRLTPATMLGKPHVDLAKSCGVGHIILFYGVSDRLLLLRDPELQDHPALAGRDLGGELPGELVARARDNALQRILESVRHATGRGLDLRVDFAAEDASRADPDFLVRCLRELGPYLEHFVLCDTVGVLQPERASRWVSELREASRETPLGVHFHDDCGLALENTLAAVQAGASLVSGTFGGIGERAGNVALDRVLQGLRLRYGLEVTGIDYDAVARLVATLDERGYRPARPYSPESQRHESGIHVHALLRDPGSYSIFPDAEPEIWFGRFSGASNFEYLCERVLGEPREPADYERMAAELKRRAAREGRCWSPDEVAEWIARGTLA